MRVEFEGDDRAEIVEQMCNFLSNTADTLNFPDILLWRHERAISYFKHVALRRTGEIAPPTHIEGDCRFSLSFVGETEPWEMFIELDEEGHMHLDCFPDKAGCQSGNELECSVEAIPPERENQSCGGKRIKIRCVLGPGRAPDRFATAEVLARLERKKHVNPSDE